MSEREYVLNMLDRFAKPGAIFAMVADSYNVFEFCEMLGNDSEIRKKIEEHGKTGGYVVIRPDSGDPVEVVTHVAKLLDKTFGSTVNTKGFKLLNNVRIIQGDGINAGSVKAILESLMANGFCADNVAFGMGGALLGAPQRDDQKFALKCSAALIDGTWVDVQKDPVTDHGKRSKKGRLGLVYECGLGSCGFHTVPEEVAAVKGDVLRTVFEDGDLLLEDTFANIRKRAVLQDVQTGVIWNE